MNRTLVEAVAIVIVIIFLFLGSIRSVLIPVVTIPLSIVGGCMLMLALGFSLNLLTLLAMVLAIGLVVDDAIVVVENVHRHIEEGMTPVQAALVGAREIAGPVVAMTITLAAVYAPIGFLTGLTGALFREFAFTLAGAVIISGVVALTLSPMMCSLILKPHGSQGRFANFVDRTFTRVENAVWPPARPDARLPPGDGAVRDRRAGDHRPSCSPTPAPSWRRRRTRASSSRVIKAPQYANLDYVDAYGKQLDEAFASFPETDTRFIVNGMQGGPSSGIAGMILKPWDERNRNAQALNPLVQGKLSEITGEQVFAFSLPPLPGSTGGLPVQMVISSPAGYETVFNLMEQIKAEARKSGLFIVTDSDLAFNNPVIRIKVDRSKANDLGITMAVGRQHAGDHGRRQLRQPLQPERPLLRGDPAGAARRAADAGEPRQLLRQDASAGEPRAAVDRGADRHRHRPQRADPVQPAQLGHLLGRADARASPWARRWSSSSSQAKECCPADFQHAYLSDSRQYVTEGNQLAITFVVRPDRDLSGAGRAVRIPARPVRDPGQRADVDLRRAAAAVLRPRHPEHLHADRPGDADRPDQQARHPDGRVRQRAAAQREPGPAPGDRSGRPGCGCGRS